MGLPAISTNQWTDHEYLQAARDVLTQEQTALQHLIQHLPLAFADAVRTILECQGAVLVSGIGKAGWIGQKISASLASTGTLSHFVHPSEAVHGDFGRIGDRDLMLILSNSGNTPEVNQLLPTLRRRGIPIIALTATDDSELARAAQIVLAYGKHPEACHLNLAPSTSTTLMLALGDALCLVTARRRQWTAYDFSQHHPGGALGLKLSSVEEIMRPLSQCRIAAQELTVREVFVRLSSAGRRTGAVLLVDSAGKLSGLFTDSDLAKLLEQQRDGSLDRPISEVMTRRPFQTTVGTKTTQAVQLLARHNISELPVVNPNGEPQGMVDITDVLKLLPPDFAATPIDKPSLTSQPITLRIHHDEA
ncbi:MAG: KpsF/GutQ family sugar-phosphate isomerase [Planctomycetaceae bacterium]|nr:KpsF/GutQ family sugar-phosphate isomerase [Planctomycetaceae bacterium]